MKGFSPSSKPIKDKKKTNFNMRELVVKAFNLYQHGKHKESFLLFEKLLEQDCKDPNFLSNYAVLLKRKGQFKKAKNLLKEAIKLYPKRSEAYCNISLILSIEGNHNEAINYIKQALLLDPENSTYLYNYGLFLLRNGQFDIAKDLFSKVINIAPDYDEAYAEKALACVELCEYDEAENLLREAIRINSNSPVYLSNLASVLNTKGQFFDAGEFAIKAINFKSNHAKPFYILSNSKSHSSNQTFLDQLFSDEFERGLSKINKVDLYFARANILHRQSNFKDAAKYLFRANNLKLSIFPSDAKKYIRVCNKLLDFSNKIEYPISNNNKCDCIFIVGMPRSGSTLTESIISMNRYVFDLGESNLLESSFVESMVSQDIKNLYKIKSIYYEKRNRVIGKIKEANTITTDKQLYNFGYIPFIVSQFPGARIIHCIRNPLDNILSIFRAHFAAQSRYSSSLIDCAKFYSLHDRIMYNYKDRFNNKVYTLDYDLLVQSPENEIRRMIDWLGWEWEDIYLSPHLNKRSVNTASNVSVRSPINKKSMGGWKKYKELLLPAINEFSKSDSYKFLLK